MELLSLIPTLLLAALLVWREIAHDKRVNELLDRIQAPERVIYERSGKAESVPAHVPYDAGVWGPPAVNDAATD